MRKIEVWVRQVIWAFNKTLLPDSGDLVLYGGIKYYIKPSLTAEDTWNLYLLGSKGIAHRRVAGRDLSVVRSFRGSVRVFKSHLNFQKHNWGMLDCLHPVGRRLIYLSSYDIRYIIPE